MKLRCIFAQRICRYPGEFAPELVDAWSEYVLEDNPEGYAEVLKRERGFIGTEYEDIRELDIEVPDPIVYKLFEVPIVRGLVDVTNDLDER